MVGRAPATVSRQIRACLLASRYQMDQPSTAQRTTPPLLLLTIKQFIRIELPRLEGVGALSRDKPILTHDDLAAIVHFYLACDEVPVLHERIRVQSILAMLLMAYTGVRPGSIMEATYHANTNEGLVYGDVEVTLVKSNGSLQIVLGVRIRHRKHRRYTGEAYGNLSLIAVSNG